MNKKYSENLAIYDDRKKLSYILGLIATDGNLRNNPKSKQVCIKLHEKDAETVQFIADSLIIEKFKLQICGSKDRKNQLCFVATLPIFWDFCVSLGITPAKTYSLNINYTNWLEDNFMYFLMGCIAGDGCVHIDKKPYNCNISIVSASYEFIKVFKEKLGGSVHKDNNTYCWRISSRGARDLSVKIPIEDWMMKRKVEKIIYLKNMKMVREEGTSKFIGVSRLNKLKSEKYQVVIKHRYVGTFDNEEDAARAYDSEAIKTYGYLAKLNFE